MSPTDVAIIGYACRLPGQVSTPEDLWELCTRKRDGWSLIPEERFSLEAYHHPNPSRAGTLNPGGGYFLRHDLGRFDASFFNITALEAISMDPQQRILLECTFEALESAGIAKERIAGRNVGVYVGGNFSDYEVRNVRDLETAPLHQATGCAPAMQSNRISHYFDLKGPSLTIDTACSGSLVALHHAVKSLQLGESSEAIVAGCRLNILPDFFVTMSMSQLFNEAGKTYAFDEKADSGFARGEGAGVVLLKRLDEAIRDRDPIRAVICGTGVNQDGKTQGITNPNGDAQRDLIHQVYKDAQLDIHSLAYAEMHGTGTKVGDPIEAKAIHQALSIHRSREDPLYIGSVKSNVGHLEGASGVISLIKASMMLEKKLLLPTANFRKANPAIPMDDWNLKVLTTTKPWPQGKKYVSVSNYGFGGTNAHAVLCQPSSSTVMKQNRISTTAPKDPDSKLFILSANDHESLEQRAKDICVYIQQRPEAFEKLQQPNLAHSLGSKRSHLGYRLAVSATSLDDLGDQLARTQASSTKVLREPRTGFIFTGQGAQWPQMGMDLFNSYPIFASAIRRADDYLTTIGASFSLLTELQKAAIDSSINEPHISQPACTALQVGLIDLFKHWGISSNSVVGHSSGEIAAAYAAGIYNADSAMALAYHRGMMTLKLKQLHPAIRGRMMAVGISADIARSYMANIRDGYCTIACINSPSSVTISGDADTLAQLKQSLDADMVFSRMLKIDVAYHSEHMALVSELYRDSIRNYQPGSRMSAKFYSSVYGREVTDSAELGPDYWVKNLISTVLFPDAVTPMCSVEDKPDLLLELGPHPAMKGAVADILNNMDKSSMKPAYIPSVVRGTSALQSVQEAAGSSYVHGAKIDMTAINFPSSNAEYATFLTDLPRYPWQHKKSYWHHSRIARKHNTRDQKRNDILGVLANFSNDLEPTWRNIIRLDDVPWLRDHKMQGMVVFPMAGYLSMAVEAVQQQALANDHSFDTFELRDVTISSALTLIEDTDAEMTITLRAFNDVSTSPTDVWQEFKICSWNLQRTWAEHCRGLIRVQDSTKHIAQTVTQSHLQAEMSIHAKANKATDQSKRQVDVPCMYAKLETAGAGYGRTFRGLQDCYSGGQYSRGRIVMQDTKSIMPKEFESDLVIHASLLDIFLHLAWPILGAAEDTLQCLYMPTQVKSVKIARETISKAGDYLSVWCSGNPDIANPKPTTFEICAYRPSNTGKPVIKFDGFVMTPILDNRAANEPIAKKICYKLTSYPCVLGKLNPTRHDSGLGLNKYNEPLEEIVNVTFKASNTISASECIEVDTQPIDSDIMIMKFGSCDEFAKDLIESIHLSTGSQPSMCELGKVNCSSHRVILLELADKSLRSISPDDFSNLQHVLLHAKEVLWVYSTDRPESSMSVGLARSIRSENSARIATLGITMADLAFDGKRSILRTIDLLWTTQQTEQVPDMEFIAKDGELFVQRVEEAEALNTFISNETGQIYFEKQPFHSDTGRRLKIQFGSYGALDTIRWVETEHESVRDDYVEIKVKATGINFKDVLVCMGQVKQPYIGIECSGIITAVGKNVSHVNVGQRVMATVEGAYSTYARCPGTSVHEMPTTMTFEDAASIPVIFCTAYYSLFDLGRLVKGEKILIHAAAGGVGQAAIKLAQHIGADIYVTVGSAEKKRLLMETYALREDRIFYSRDTSFADDIRRITYGAGVDVVLNSLSGEILKETWNCLAPFGRFIEIGKADIIRNSRLEMQKFEHNCTFASVDLSKVAAFRPQLMQRLLTDVCGMFNQGILSSIAPVVTYSLSETEDAFRALQSGRAMGKLVVVHSDSDEVLAPKPKLRSDLLPADATYLITGGTGGLGRSLARWLSSKGARNIILVSRTAKVTTDIQELIDEAAKCSTKVLVKQCDIANKDSLHCLVHQDLQELPPIRGVIHAAMVLNDILFEQMTINQFKEVTACKVEGALNLHSVLTESPLDFFICLSSIAGIVGNRGQAAYSAANVFLDEFMAYRRKCGVPGVSIDLAAVSDAGYLKDGTIERRNEVLRNLGNDQTINESEVLALIAAAIDGKIDEMCHGQCLTGLKSNDQNVFWLADRKFDVLRKEIEANASLAETTKPGQALLLKALLQDAKEGEEASDARDVLYDALATKIAVVLDMPIAAIQPSQTLKKLGLDSLVAIELRNWISRETETNIQVLELLGCGSVMGLVEYILKKMGVV